MAAKKARGAPAVVKKDGARAAEALAARLAREIRHELEGLGTTERAEQEKRYLKSALEHIGVTVPGVRKVARRAASTVELDRDVLLELVDMLWTSGVHELRFVAVELLDARTDLLRAGDMHLLERLLRESKTWALVDNLCCGAVEKLLAAHPKRMRVLDAWATDEDFWIRRSALLAQLVPLRRGDGDFDRFGRYADAMLGETEFFVRKAIGWVLRDTSRRRPQLVARWVKPRAARMSGLTFREAVKRLPESTRGQLVAARNAKRASARSAR